MYYVIETKYVGPNQLQDQYTDVDTIAISTTPAITNSSHEERTQGWCGTTNDWAVYAHGEYATLEEARAAIAQEFGDVRSDETADDENVVELYKPGKYAPMSREATEDWTFDGIQESIDADTTDERIAELVAEFEEIANGEGYTLDSDLDDLMKARRQELQDERDEDE